MIPDRLHQLRQRIAAVMRDGGGRRVHLVKHEQQFFQFQDRARRCGPRGVKERDDVLHQFQKFSGLRNRNQRLAVVHRQQPGLQIPFDARTEKAEEVVGTRGRFPVSVFVKNARMRNEHAGLVGMNHFAAVDAEEESAGAVELDTVERCDMMNIAPVTRAAAAEAEFKTVEITVHRSVFGR